MRQNRKDKSIQNHSQSELLLALKKLTQQNIPKNLRLAAEADHPHSIRGF